MSVYIVAQDINKIITCFQFQKENVQGVKI